ncbi:MAG: hypothetical protein J4400_05930 [Candidatus Aenigmarchaeota archaeon]|nr:hypothetical protein [Candidatus Aenigmarchaeota archaeon]
MYVAKGIKKLGLCAALAAGLAGCGGGGPPVHVLSNDWVTEVYSKDTDILNAYKTPAYVFEECPSQGGPCTQYVFPGDKASVDRAVTRMKKGESYTFTTGNLDSIREAK